MALTGDRGPRYGDENPYDTETTDTGASTPGGYLSQTAGKVADAVLGKDTTVSPKVNILTVAVLAGLAYIIFRKK